MDSKQRFGVRCGKLFVNMTLRALIAGIQTPRLRQGHAGSSLSREILAAVFVYSGYPKGRGRNTSHAMTNASPPDAMELVQIARAGDGNALGNCWLATAITCGSSPASRSAAGCKGKSILPTWCRRRSWRGRCTSPGFAGVRAGSGGLAPADLGRGARNHSADTWDPRPRCSAGRELAGELDHSSQALNFALADPGPTPSKLAVGRERTVLLADALAGCRTTIAR